MVDFYFKKANKEKYMKVALIGASGMAGSSILNELVTRGHQVTAIARSPEKIAQYQQVEARQADINDTAQLMPLLVEQDAVISAVHFTDTQIEHLLDALKETSVPRYLMVGGAGGLILESGQRLVDDPKFPEHVKPEALAGIAILETLRQEPELNWTVLSPSMIFKSGERTGQFRLGKEELLTKDGMSHISTQDYAVALIDELEKPQHIRERFTVGY
ncbi:NAD(P)-dependent oxidoreductase [Acinetobacter nosocomialis]|nr:MULTISPECIES: NAD(P)-dependent oxidoreductase [Acinetobacter]MCZ2961420.1 NAD(P)-dependent oxidoreductase [Acinetobacter baumannii]MCZ3210829.1 NAD(P)-dependent oxidoreductase [Acinetobacter baumannii]MCZ3293471.1 NAD(P)-dependent oxidoreductase [Acinetobacter baumannii]MDQ9042469.1 NAD(P)-dependent oxidoreductase [Acinetobacter nosocomialis]MDQ9905761.1 NAD(P)-dependent oxidoreductase [Acinetobacter sp. 148]